MAKKGDGKMRRGVLVLFTVACSRCDDVLPTSAGKFSRQADATKYFRSKGWKIKKGLWVCPACQRNEAIGKSPLATRVAEAAQKAMDRLFGEAREEKDRPMRAVTLKDASDFRTIRDFAKAGDLKAAAKHYGNMDTAARDYLECDDEALGALGYERIGRRR